MKLKRYILGGYAIWVTLLTGAYYSLPGLHIEEWGLINLSALMAIAVGLFVNRPSRKTPWLLLGAALMCFAVGQMTFLIQAHYGIQLPFPSYADAFYIACCPLYAAGLLVIIYWRTSAGDQRRLSEALTVAAGLALLLWTYLIAPYARNPGLSELQKSVAIAYPLGDILMLVVTARLLALGRPRLRCIQFLILAVISCVVADVAYNSIQLYAEGPFGNGTIIDFGWILFFAFSGAAALHPTMVQLTQFGTGQQVQVSHARVTLMTMLMLASFFAPIVLFTM